MGATNDSASDARFETVFDAHYLHVLAYAVRRADSRAEAEDVVADTFAVVWGKRAAIPDEPIPWLYAIAHRVVANQRRAGRRRRRLGERLAAEPPRLGRDPATLVAQRDGVRAAMARLSEADREILRLVAWEGLDTRAGAKVVGCTPAAFRMRLHRARRELGRHLDTDSFTTPARAGANPLEEANG